MSRQTDKSFFFPAIFKKLLFDRQTDRRLPLMQANLSTPWALPSWVRTFFHGAGVALRYVIFFKWVVDLARWMISTGGNIAESAFLIATVYVTINTVAHTLVAWLLPQNVIMTLNQVAVIAFSVLPELIIFAALAKTFDHFKLAFQNKKHLDMWAWAVCYAIPTSVFLYLTVVTISSFVSVEAVNATTAPQATGAMLVTRCLAGWGYGLLQMLFIQLGKDSYSGLFARLRAEIVALVATVAARDASIAALQSSVATLEDEKALLQSDLATARLSLAKVTRGKEKSTLQSGEKSTPEKVEKSTSDTVNSAKYQRLKSEIERAILGGDKVNLKKISAAAGVSYNMARRNAQNIIDALGPNTDKLHVVRPVEEEESA
jgi:hypothetical protein